MKRFIKPIAFISLFTILSSFSFFEEPQYSGTDCGELAMDHYAYLTSSEVDAETAFVSSLEMLLDCEDNK